MIVRLVVTENDSELGEKENQQDLVFSLIACCLGDAVQPLLFLKVSSKQGSVARPDLRELTNVVY